ncbi:MAG: hypothetical protein B7C24_09280 [Bacteroidetes bacterium 4572_77]|nr:MAG: hypothetical protein B7C24_09280 [Bacteroidetes bacterium 4572_77]
MKIVLKLVLLVIIVGLGYIVVESIMEPVRFNQEKDMRAAIVIQKLEDVRAAELAYKAVNGQYMSDWDTLISFIKNNEFPIVKEIADPNDTTMTKVIRDTIGFMSISDSLYGHRENFIAEHLKYVPIPKEFFNNETFALDAGVITRGGLPVHVFESSADYKTILKGMDNQLIINLNKQLDEMNKYSGLKVGSMSEASTEGNWK